MESLGQRIKRFRKALKLSQAALGDRIGVSQATISQWEDGTINIPSAHLAGVATIFGIREADLMNQNAVVPGETVEQIRLACITAILNASHSELEIFMDTFPELFEAPSDERKSGSSL